jgi:hypothetical protein
MIFLETRLQLLGIPWADLKDMDENEIMERVAAAELLEEILSRQQPSI